MKYKNLSRLMHNSAKGFTLIELLIVIAIIGILSSLGLNAYTQVQARARDSQRKTDLQQIRLALEVYRSDNDSYPSSVGSYMSSDGTTELSCGSSLSSGGNTYMQSMPCDPRGPTTTKYIYVSAGSSYSLVACLENSTDKDAEVYPGAYPNGCDSGVAWANGYGYLTQSP